ncbi:MAG TPA: hypothetical protein VF556_16925 [Pyrinomonadaceae bacterium]|jgi:hypothetical protein
MRKIILSFTIGLLFIFNLACGSSTPTTTSSTNAASTPVKVDEKDIPPEFSTKPITPSGNSTPGIPDEKNIGKPIQKGATPIPGIPNEKTLEKQLKGAPTNANASNSAATDANATTSGEGRTKATPRKF